MIACLICEKEVADDRLGPHSAKCRELAEFKEILKNIVIKMENHGEKAEKMKNTLETYTAKRQMYSLPFLFPNTFSASEAREILQEISLIHLFE